MQLCLSAPPGHRIVAGRKASGSQPPCTVAASFPNHRAAANMMPRAVSVAMLTQAPTQKRGVCGGGPIIDRKAGTLPLCEAAVLSSTRVRGKVRTSGAGSFDPVFGASPERVARSASAGCLRQPRQVRRRQRETFYRLSDHAAAWNSPVVTRAMLRMA